MTRGLNLTEEQRAVVECVDDPVLVLAMVGSGKTLTMAERLARAIDKGVVPADRTLCLSFTNRAAREIRERVCQHLGERAAAVTCCTFHRFCAEVLRHDGDLLGIPREFLIVDDTDGPEILQELLQRHDRSTPYPRADAYAKRLWDLFSQIKLAQESPDQPVAKIITSRAFADANPVWVSTEIVSDLFQMYDRELSAMAALDFSDLIRYVRFLFSAYDECRRRWAEKCAWIQVDEVQDTHLSEYLVLEMLARDHGQLSFFGDLAQTIYEWRGSRPDEVLARYSHTFKPRRFVLSYNFRATQALVGVAAEVLRRYPASLALPVSAPETPAGDPVTVVSACNAEAEAEYIARDLRAQGWPEVSAVVLTRTRKHAAKLARGLLARNVQTCVVDHFEFFRRMEVKDALALLRLVLNRFDAWSARRLLLRLRTGLGAHRITRLATEHGPQCQLRLSDLLMARTWRKLDPFGSLLTAWENGSVVVLDVETTGLDPETAEVLEFFGARVSDGRIEETLHLYLWPVEGPLGAQEIHGLSEETLRAKGIPPREAFQQIARFLNGAHVLGHNVVFDLDVLHSHARRCNVALPAVDWDDTRELARRIDPEADRFDLATLAARYGLEHVPTHRARDDVYATVELAGLLLPVLRQTASSRRRLLQGLPERIEEKARILDGLRDYVDSAPPSTLLAKGVEAIGIKQVYENDYERHQHLRQLVQYVSHFEREQDKKAGRPLLQSVLHKCSLVRNVDLTMLHEGLPVLPVHQVKGMEFDVVYVAGLRQDQFPLPAWGARSKDEEEKKMARLREEHRIFYVAVTRPKRRLVLLGNKDSQFLRMLSDSSWVTIVE